MLRLSISRITPPHWFSIPVYTLCSCVPLVRCFFVAQYVDLDCFGYIHTKLMGTDLWAPLQSLLPVNDHMIPYAAIPNEPESIWNGADGLTE